MVVSRRAAQWKNTLTDVSDETPHPPIVAVIGATGRVGQYVFRGAVDRGYHVRALVRDRDKLDVNENVTIIQGSILDPVAVRALIEGVDVVLSVLGSRPKEPMIVGSGTRVLVDAIRAREVVPRVVHMSSLGIGDSYPQCRKLSWFFAASFRGRMSRYLLRTVFADMEEAETILTGAPVIPTVRVRATVLKEKGGAHYRCLSAQDPPGKFFIRRQTVASFFLDAVTDKTWDGTAVSLFSA